MDYTDHGLALLHRDLKETMVRLKTARAVRNPKDSRVFENRLNWLLDRLHQAYADRARRRVEERISL